MIKANEMHYLPNKFDKWCISLAFVIRIYHNAQSSDCQRQAMYV